ncbi:MAG: AbiV family abortive infection protein [Candidatus Omnitrophota bacterium]
MDKIVPSEKTLDKLKAEIYVNAIRLFVDACHLFKKRSQSSALAFAILSLEELGKLEMVDHICDDILHTDYKPQEFLDQLFSRSMFLNHKNKQMWASGLIFTSEKQRVKEISEGMLDRAKQDALYVGYYNRRIKSPRKISPLKVFNELTIVYHKFIDVADLGFNGFYCSSDSQSRAKAKRYLKKVESAYLNLKKPKRNA